jgi:hypothetical protein
MSVRSLAFLIVCGITFCLLASSGCVSTNIGNVAYSAGNLTILFSHSGEPSGGYVQVTVYVIKNNQQEEMDTWYAPVNLHPGENTASVAGTLEPGHYKLYIYLIQNGERKAATIRDLVVN